LKTPSASSCSIASANGSSSPRRAASTSPSIGLIVAFQPSVWIGLFSDDAEVARLGSLYLRIVGPTYLLFGLGLGLFYVTLGFGRAVAAMNANAVRMMTSAGLGLVAVYWLDLGVAGFFAAVAAGFCVYAALLVRAVFGVRAPDGALATSSASR
jgi:Na+-driven multidrug efflux pump